MNNTSILYDIVSESIGLSLSPSLKVGCYFAILVALYLIFKKTFHKVAHWLEYKFR